MGADRKGGQHLDVRGRRGGSGSVRVYEYAGQYLGADPPPSLALIAGFLYVEHGSRTGTGL
jgi:hypothetical protein